VSVARRFTLPVADLPVADLRVAAVILAAGASSRMGRNKMLLDVDGVPMVRRAAQVAIDAGCSPVVIVVGNDESLVRDALHGMPCNFAVNADFTGPTSGSLHAGLNAIDATTDATIVLLADMVRVTTPMLLALIASARASDAPLCVSRYGDVLAPPLLFRRILWPELLAWHGEGCGKAVVKAHQNEALIHDWPAESLRDIDTPDDYQQLVSAS
jgi:molybdenum cofactor cytidylyltransferase